MKKLFSLVLCAALILGCCPIIPLQASADAVASGTCGVNLTWTLDDAGTLTISGTGPMRDYSWGSTPWFDMRSSIKTVIIGDGVTTIGDYSIYSCDSLTSVTIGDSVITIGDYGFFSCHSLTGIWVDADNPLYSSDDRGMLFNKDKTKLIKAAYAGISGAYTIPDSVTTIGDRAFEKCTSLTSVTIGGNVTTIGQFAFSDCDSLTSATIGDSVTTISYPAFSDCDSLIGIWVDADNPSFSSDDRGVLFNKDKTELTKAPGGISGAYTIPDSVTTIGGYAFNSCNNLTSVTIGDSVTTIGTGAFSDRDSLTSVTIPDSVTTIGTGAFSDCDSLTSVTIPDSVTTIGGSAFDSCNDLTSVIIGDSVTTIGGRAFEECTSLTSVTIPDSVTTIDLRAFADCDSLKDVYYCGSMAQWEQIAIDAGNSDLTTATLHTVEPVVLTGITVHSLPTKIYYWVGESMDTTGLVLIATYSDGSTQDITEGYTISDFDSVTAGTKTVTVMYEGFTATFEVSVVRESNSIVASGTCGDNLTWTLDETGVLTISGTGSMMDYNFEAVEFGEVDKVVPWYSQKHSIKKIMIEFGATTIGSDAFYGCENMTLVTIPDSVRTIGSGAFGNCYELNAITIPDSVTLLDESAFYGCKSLIEVLIPDSVTTISRQTFCGCENLTTVTIPDSVTNIEESAFFYCDNLSAVTIPDSVTTIGEMAFYSCDNLSTATIGNNVTTIGESAFDSCYNLTTIIIPNSVTTIGDYAFYNCTGLTEVNIGDGVITIGDSAFCDCTSLTGVTIPDSVITIGDSAFKSCTSLKDVYYCGSMAQWEQIAIADGNSDLTTAALHTVEPVVTRVAIQTLLTKIYYWVGENLDTTGLVLTATYSDGSTQDITEGYTVSGFDSTTVGIKTVTITYEGCIATFEVNVVDDSDKIVDSNGNCYATLIAAIEAVAENGKLTIVKDVIENITVDKSVSLDLNGFSINGTVTIKDGIIVYGIDVQTDDYTIKDDKGYGKIKNVVLEGSGKLMGLPAESDLAEHGYMMITEEDGVSFHCVNLKLKAMTLRSKEQGIYFKSDFAGDELVAENIKQFGVALCVYRTPAANNMETHCRYSKFTQFSAGKQDVDTTSTLLKGVMKTRNTDAVNNRNANMSIYGRAYILTNDGEYIFGATASRTFREQVEGADALWADLSEEQQTALLEMYEQFTDVMKSWNLPHLKNAIA